MLIYRRFGDFEVIMATRTTLLRSARQQAQKTEIGDIISPIGQRFLTSERDMLLRVAQEARRSDQAQVALNAVTRAQALESSGAHSLVIQEFSSVLWSLHEQKPAIQSLKPLACAKEDTQMEADLERAIVLARLVSEHLGVNATAYGVDSA
jgi:ataxia telangiectasia mutated family protein